MRSHGRINLLRILGDLVPRKARFDLAPAVAPHTSAIRTLEEADQVKFAAMSDETRGRGNQEAGKEARPGPQKESRSSPRSDAGTQGCPQPDARQEPLRVVIYPFHGPNKGIDIADALVDTIAMILWKLQRGNEPVNRLEASVLLERAMRPQINESSS